MQTLQELGGERQGLDVLFQHTHGIGANSGGSWFLTQLAFAEDYANQLQARQGRDSYLTNGCLGRCGPLQLAAVRNGSCYWRLAALAVDFWLRFPLIRAACIVPR